MKNNRVSYAYEKSDVAFQSAITAGEWFIDILSQNNGKIHPSDVTSKIVIQILIASFSWSQELLNQGIQPSEKFRDTFFTTKGYVNKIFNPK